MDTPSGTKDSIPAWIKYSVQPPGEIPYNGIYYDPPEEVSCIFYFISPCYPAILTESICDFLVMLALIAMLHPYAGEIRIQASST
jgi:hypothetical protein